VRLPRSLEAPGRGTWQRRYEYDRYGNPTGSWDATSGGNQLQSIRLGTTGGATNNRIATVNGVSYTYDAAGDVTSDALHAYQYDCEGRIAKVDPETSSEADYFYDLNNWRVKKVTGAGGSSPVTTYYVWDVGRVLAEYSTAAPTGNGVRYYHPDRLSSRMITDATGNVIGTEDVLPFGEDAGTGSGVSEKHRFTNYERDSETAENYGVNRQYASGSGRFMQADPFWGSPDIPQSLDLYTYAMNDSTDLFDPLGLRTCFIWQEDTSYTRPDGTIVLSVTMRTECFDDINDIFIIPGLQRSFGDYNSGGAGRFRIEPQTRAVTGALNVCGAAASFGQYSKLSGGMWRGANGKWYSMRWGGNQYTGARSGVFAEAGGLRVLGNVAGLIGIGFSASNLYSSVRSGDTPGAAKSGVDISMGGVGMFGGPVGATASAVYFGVDMTVGWPAVGKAVAPTPQECQRVDRYYRYGVR